MNIAKLGRYLVYAVFFACTWIIHFIITALICVPFMDDEVSGFVNALIFLAVFVLPVLASIWATKAFATRWAKVRKERERKEASTVSEPATDLNIDALPKLPFSRQKRIENVQALVHEASYEYDCALAATSPDLFVIHWDATASTLEELERYRDTVPGSYFTSVPRKSSITKDFQWKLRDSMERSVKIVVAELKGPHHNNKNGRFADYKSAFELYSDRYDAETMDFACAIMKTVAKAAGILEFDFCGKHLVIAQEETARNANTLEIIDFMEGHEFEYWCAKLLTDIGYKDVTVTQASGDQGVDVLAQKDGIKYAVQCKCYSSDLGNTPVQEVLAGKKFYHCHVGAVMTNRHFTKGAKALAAETGILLWDRDWINRALKTSTHTKT